MKDSVSLSKNADFAQKIPESTQTYFHSRAYFLVYIYFLFEFVSVPVHSMNVVWYVFDDNGNYVLDMFR